MNTTKFNLRYIIVQTTNSMMTVHEVNNLHYHYLVTPKGRLICRREVEPKDGAIEIGLMSDWDPESRQHVRTEEQNDTLFQSFAELSEKYPEAKILNADESFIMDVIDQYYPVTQEHTRAA